jgi:hypothetical protein
MSIDEALVIIQEAAFEGQSFSIRFWTLEGIETYYPRARYGAPDSWSRKAAKIEIQEKLGTAVRGQRKISLLRDDGGIPITDLETKSFKTPKWYGIFELNGEIVN